MHGLVCEFDTSESEEDEAILNILNVDAPVASLGFYGFSVGLFGAGLSSALTIPLGCALSIEDLYGLHTTDDDAAGGGAAAATRPWDAATWWRRRLRPVGMGLFLGLSVVPSLMRWPTIAIITTAQVVNGLLLPCVTSALLYALNHAGVMGAAGPQPRWLNALMLPCVGVTMLLACVVLLKQSLGRALGAAGPQVAIVTAMPLAAVLMLALARRALRAREPPHGGRGSRGRGARTLGADGVIEVTLSEPGAQAVVVE